MPLVESRDFALVRGVAVGILPQRSLQKKLEWCGCEMVKNFENMFIRFSRIHERDEQTNRQMDIGHRMTA